MDITIKPTYRCNFTCDYCYIHEVKTRSSLSIEATCEILATAAEESTDGHVLVKWHGGEPTLMGVDYYEAVFAYQQTLPVRFENAIFTNLWSLNDRLLALYRDHDVQIFTSLDTVVDDHDGQRGGHNRRIIDNLLRLRDAGHHQVTVKSTVTSANVGDLQATYAFFKDLPFAWNFAPVFPADKGREHVLNVLPDPAEFVAQSTAIFDDWWWTGHPQILLFDQILKAIVHPGEPGIPRPMFNVDAFGDVYTCPQMQGDDRYLFGPFDGNRTVREFATRRCDFSDFHADRCDECAFEWVCKINHCAFLGDCFQGLEARYVDQFCDTMKPLYDHMARTFVQQAPAVLAAAETTG